MRQAKKKAMEIEMVKKSKQEWKKTKGFIKKVHKT